MFGHEKDGLANFISRISVSQRIVNLGDNAIAKELSIHYVTAEAPKIFNLRSFYLKYDEILPPA